MGQEILYCWKCNTRILGSDFEKGTAFQVGHRSSCGACASELLATLPPGEREKLLARMFKSKQERGGTSRSTARVHPPTVAPARRPKPFPTGLALGAAGGLVGLVLLIVLLSGGPPPPPTPPTPAPPAPSAETHPRARAALAKAREAARSRPEDVDTLSLLWQEAMWAAENTPLLDEARREYGLIAARLGREENELRALIAKEEFKKALDFLRSAKRRDWAEKKAVETLELPKRFFPDLKQRALAGDVKAVEERVAKWGLEEYAAELRKALKEIEGLIRPSGDGLICFEAEAFHGREDRKTHAWARVDGPAGAAGGAAMSPLPNVGESFPTNYAVRSPRLDYKIQFATAGTYHVWVRGAGPGPADDSLHVGLDGQELITGGVALPSPSWFWNSKNSNGGRLTLDVAAAGPHTFNLWMREDGSLVDRFVLTLDATWTPKGEGPPASPR